MSTSRPFAPSSYPDSPTMTEIRQEGPRNYSEWDFSTEDSVSRWRAVGLFGGLILSEGILLLAIFTSFSSNVGTTFFAPILVVGLVAALPLLIWSYTYEALAVIAGAAASVVVGWFFPLNGIIALGLQVLGALLLVIGIVESVIAYRSLSDEEQVDYSRGATPRKRSRRLSSVVIFVVVMVVVVILALSVDPIPHTFSATFHTSEFFGPVNQTINITKGSYVSGSWSSDGFVEFEILAPDGSSVYDHQGTSGVFAFTATYSNYTFGSAPELLSPSAIFVNGTYSTPLL